MGLASIFAVLLAGFVANGQVVGAYLTGTVKDASGAPVSGAAVVIRNAETGAVRNLVTDSEGRYSANSISVGSYYVTASHTGFTSQLRTGITLQVGQTGVVDFTLTVGEFKQEITVEEAPSPVMVSPNNRPGWSARAR